MMNLAVDIGNTNVKAAVFEGSERKDYFISGQKPEPENFASFIKKHAVDRAVYACVGRKDNELLRVLLKQFHDAVELTTATPLPFGSDYKTPETLGSDRIALAAGAQKYADEAMAVDVGTCITYDIIAGKTYLGGAITPGIKMRLRAMHEFTAALPLLETPENALFPGKSTQECMQSGGISSAEHEINGFIETFRRQFPEGKVILTGGDANHLADRLKYYTFANRFLQLEGLNEILNYQR